MPLYFEIDKEFSRDLVKEQIILLLDSIILAIKLLGYFCYLIKKSNYSTTNLVFGIHRTVFVS